MKHIKFSFLFQLTWADIVVSDIITTLSGDRFGGDAKAIGAKLAKEHSDKVSAYVDSIFDLPNIKKWIETRPKTEN